MSAQHEQLYIDDRAPVHLGNQSSPEVSEAIEQADVELPPALALNEKEQASVKRRMGDEGMDFLTAIRYSVSYKKFMRIHGWLEAKRKAEELAGSIASRPTAESSHASVEELAELVRGTFTDDKAA